MSVTSRFGGRFARHRRIIVRRCSHGAVSPCWREQRHESASTFRPCQDYNICETGSRLIIAGLCLALVSAVVPAQAEVNVTQFHNHESRDGLYIDSAFAHSAAANLARDMNFDGTIVGNLYAQPLYIEGGPGGER